eukprot:UN23814
MKRCLIVSTAIFVVLLAVVVNFISQSRELKYFYGVVFKQSAADTDCDNMDDYTPSRRYDHCFTEDRQFHRMDVGHDEETLKKMVVKSIESRCPMVLERPFNKHIKWEDWLRTAKNDDMVNVKSWGDHTIGAHLQNYTWPRYPLTFPHDQPLSVGVINEAMKKPNNYSVQFGAGIEVFDQFDMMTAAKDLFPGGYFPTDLFIRHTEISFVSTPMHAAFFDSFVYQSSGSKFWMFQNPDDSMATACILSFTGMYRDCNFKDINKHILYNITINEDEMLYFPPFWAHSVITIGAPKPNLMFNVRRFPNMPKLWYNMPKYALLSAGLTISRL